MPFGMRKPSALSIGQKLPLLMCGVVLLVSVALGTAAYVQVHGLAARAANERLSSVAGQLASLFQGSVDQLGGVARKVAADSDVGAYVRTRDPALMAAAQKALRYNGPQAEQMVGIELRDSTGRSILAALTPVADSFHYRPDTLPLTLGRDSVSVGKMQAHGTAILYPVVARVSTQPGTRVVVWRRLIGSQKSRDQISGLIGSDAVVFFGNADGSVFTDLAGATFQGAETRKGDMLEATRNIRGSPWAVRVDFPRGPVFAPVRTFLRSLILIGFICIALAFVIAWVASRRVIWPLDEITNAAIAIGHGDFSREVPVKSNDEFGQVAASFNIMSREIQDAQRLLEDRVTERTRELNETLRQLHDTQDALVRREKMALMGQLASGVGHELRNPLGVMSNAIYYLRAVLTAPSPKVQEYLDILKAQVTLSERIISDLLDFARIKDPRREQTTMAKLVATQLERASVPPGIQVDLTFPPDLPPANIDPMQIGQVVLNLIVNAIQAMEGEGRLTIRGRVDDAGQVFVEVADSGPGIDPANLEKIFEALFTTKARGIGLGLAVSRSLARANGGDIQAATSPDGAIFSLTVPAVTAAAYA